MLGRALGDEIRVYLGSPFSGVGGDVASSGEGINILLLLS